MNARRELEILESEKAALAGLVNFQIDRIKSGTARVAEIANYERNATRLQVLEREIAHVSFKAIMEKAQ